MGDIYFKLLNLFGKNDLWTKKNLLHHIKDETLIEEALSLGYIVQCGVTDILEPQYCITELGIKVRNN